MEPAAIERLKREWTGRRVEAVGPSPALRRFAGRAGTVITVNMNGRALVQFDGGVDITWYDLAIEDLRTVIAPTRGRDAGKHATPVPAIAAPAPEAAAASIQPMTHQRPDTRIILELARQQGAAKRS
ncbi:MAG: hypothetical protein WBC44_03320 [Planctomycetaceae bacterium]